MRPLALGLLLVPATALADHPPGTLFDPAIVVDLDAEGLSSLETLVADFVPPTFPIPVVRESGSDEECIDLIFDTVCWDWYSYVLEVSGLDVGIALSRFEVRPVTGALDVDLEITVNVASSGDPGRIYADLEVIDLISITEDCRVWLEPTPIAATTALTITVTPQPGGRPTIDVGIRPVAIDLDLSGLRMQGCVLGDLLDFVDAVNDFTSSWLSFDLYELIAGFAEPLVEDQINALLPELEQTVDEALAALSLSETFDLLGAELTLELYPSTVDIVPEGLRVGLAARADPGPDPHPCVAEYGITESVATPGAPWPLGPWPGGAAGATASVQADDDLVNQALFGLWYGGLLCFELSDAGDLDLPIPIDTSLLGLLAGDAFDDLFPETAPLVLATRPRNPPVAHPGPRDLDVTLSDLGLDLYAELDGRLTRVAGFRVDADIGADLPFDPFTGELSARIDLEDALEVSLAYNELRPAANADLEGGVGGLVDTVVGPLVGGLLGDLAFALPTIQGLGLSDLVVSDAGPQGDQLGVQASLGQVRYANDLGEDGCADGCDAGCSSRGGAAGALGWALGLVALLARRREG